MFASAIDRWDGDVYVNAPAFEPCILVVGYTPSVASLQAVKRWSEQGYNPRQIWNGFAHACVRYIERNYAIPAQAVPCEVGELICSMEQLVPTMLVGVDFAALVRKAAGYTSREVTVDLQGKPWKLIVTLHYFPF